LGVHNHHPMHMSLPSQYIKSFSPVLLSVTRRFAAELGLHSENNRFNPPEITHLNTLNRAFLTVSVFGHLEFAARGGSPKPRHGIFKDMIFRM
jgi:hypothetical protein